MDVDAGFSVTCGMSTVLFLLFDAVVSLFTLHVLVLSYSFTRL